MEDFLTETEQNGEIANIQITPIGDFIGSTSDGSPIKEHITTESLNALAKKMNESDEVLCDVDHQSCRPGVEKDSRAAGWFHKFFVDPMKGLFANLKLTKHGKELIENREYRYVSPTFTLDENNSPEDIHSISLTNVPAFKGSISPILNSESNSDKQPKYNEEINMTISKEELISLIKDTVSSMNNECSSDKTEEVSNEEVSNEEVKSEVKTEEVKTEDKTEEVSNDEVKIEEVKTEDKTEEVKSEDKTEEVIKLETLNSAPVKFDEPEWKNLHGKEFFDWCSKNKNNI